MQFVIQLGLRLGSIIPLIGGMRRLSRYQGHSVFDKDVTVFVISPRLSDVCILPVSMLSESQGVKALKSSLKHDYHRNGSFTSTGSPTVL